MTFFIPFLLHAAVVAASFSRERSKDAVDISGVYTPLDPTNLTESLQLSGLLFDPEYTSTTRKLPWTDSCPIDLEVDVKLSESNEKLIIAVQNTSSPLCTLNVGAPLELAEQVKQVNKKNRDDGYHVSLPLDLLNCSGNVFDSLTARTLRSYLEKSLEAAMKQMGVPADVVDDILGHGHGDKKYDDPHWESPFVHRMVERTSSYIRMLESHWVIQLEKSAKSNIEQESLKTTAELEGEVNAFSRFLQLFTSSRDDTNEEHEEYDGYETPEGDEEHETHSRIPDVRCLLLRGDETTSDSASQVIQKLVPVLVPLFAHVHMPPGMRPPYGELFATSDCLEGLRNITLMPIDQDMAGSLFVSNAAPWANVSINGMCKSKARFYNELEAELDPQSEVVPDAVTLSKDLAVYLLQEHLRKTDGKKKSELRSKFPEVANEAIIELAKASMHNARIYFDDCGMLNDTRTKGIVLIKRPTALFTCNGFMPAFESGGSCEGPRGEITAFLVRGGNRCMFSSNQALAANLSLLSKEQLEPSSEE